MELGANLRAMRNRRGLTVAELAAASKLSKGFVSQVENDKTSPSLDTLERLAQALDVSLVDLLSVTPKAQVAPLVRRGVLNGYARSATPEVREVGGNGGDLKVYVAELPPGGALGDAGHRHGGEETVVVLSGRVEADQAGVIVTLSEGDALTWTADQPHNIANREARPARLLVALSGNATLGLPLQPARNHQPPAEAVPTGERPFRIIEMRRRRAALSQ